MKPSTKKSYHCVKSVRKERDRIAKNTEGISPEETIEYFKKRKKKKAQGDMGENRED
jgi:hypothetical protein